MTQRAEMAHTVLAILQTPRGRNSVTKQELIHVLVSANNALEKAYECLDTLEVYITVLEARMRIVDAAFLDEKGGVQA